MIHEEKQIVIFAVFPDVEKDRLPEVEHLPRREPGHGAPQVRYAVFGQFPHPESTAAALDCDEYPGDQFRDLSELCVDVDDRGEESVGVDAVDVEEGGGAHLADVALDGGRGDLKQGFGALYRLGGHRHGESVVEEVRGQATEEIYKAIFFIL